MVRQKADTMLAQAVDVSPSASTRGPAITLKPLPSTAKTRTASVAPSSMPRAGTGNIGLKQLQKQRQDGRAGWRRDDARHCHEQIKDLTWPLARCLASVAHTSIGHLGVI